MDAMRKQNGHDDTSSDTAVADGVATMEHPAVAHIDAHMRNARCVIGADKEYQITGPGAARPGADVMATPRNDMKKPHHLPISANCGGGSAYFRCMGKLNQAGKQRLSARIRFASANNIFNFAVCFRRPRYRVFRYRNRPFTTPKTCSTFARTDDFSCSLRFN